MSKKKFVSFVSKMKLNEYESFARHLLNIDNSNKLLELFKNFYFLYLKMEWRILNLIFIIQYLLLE